MSELATSPGRSAESWLALRRRRPGAALRLFCLPYAGGGASAYRHWHELLPPWIEVCPVQPPGRENRIRERPYTSASELVAACDAALSSLTELPFALFGHSMGATLAFEWACHVRRERGREPRALIVAARAAPQLPRSAAPTHHLPDAELRERLRELDGTPSEVLADDEMMEVLLPLLRADFQIHDTYRPPDARPGAGGGSDPAGGRAALLSCPVLVYGGLDDREVTAAQLEAWRDVTSGTFRRRMLPGDHFGLLRGEHLARGVAADCAEALR